VSSDPDPARAADAGEQPQSAGTDGVAVAPTSGRPGRRLYVGRGVWRHLRASRLALNVLLFLALMYTITLTKALLIPLLLAAFLGLTLNPLVAAGTRMHLPRWLSASVLMLALIAGVTVGITQLTQPALVWFHGAPAAIRHFVPALRKMTKPIEAANRATQTLVNAPTGRRATPPVSTPLAISTWDVVSTAPKVLAAVLSVLLLVFFFLVFGDSMLRRLVEISPGFAYKRQAVVIVRGIQTEVSRYLLTALSINAGLGAVTAAMLWLYHMPDPLLWGAVAMFANFVPYVGAISTAIVLALVGMLNANDASLHALLPAVTFSAITVLEGNLVTPMVQGRSMRLSPIAILLWLLVWGWLWGVPGALLAMPMLTCTKLIAERVPSWHWFSLIVQR
jgi:predicted PurR-regulated permease PerM